MSSSTDEKKWFVYIGDHHEGPFSPLEIQDKLTEGLVNAQSYGWCEGMDDWRTMSNIPALAPIVSASSDSPGGTALAIESQANGAADEPPVPPQPELEPEPGQEAEAEVAVEDPGIIEEPARELDPKARRAAEKEAKREAKELEKRRKAEDKAAARQAKLQATLSQGDDYAAAGGGARKWVRRGIFLGVPVLFVAGTVAAFRSGALDSAMKFPVVKAAVDTVRDAGQPHFIGWIERFPFLAGVLPPIPRVEDVSPEDYEDLKSAALGSVESSGAKVTVALSSADPLAPAFHVSSNLPDGAIFDIYVEGQPDTLLNQLAFTGKVSAKVTARLGKSAALKQDDGRPLPRGEYMVYAVEADVQPDNVAASIQAIQPTNAKLPAWLPKARRVVGKKSYFLGGPKDGVYSQRLKDFHERVKSRATAELTQVRQFATTIEGQLMQSSSSFAKLRKGKTLKPLRKQWDAFHAGWLKLDGQLQESYAKWIPAVLEKEYFYGVIYALVSQAGKAVARAHEVHHSWFSGAIDAQAYDIQLGEAVSQAQAAIASLKAKIDQAEKLPRTPAGLPRKEGL